MNNFMKLSKYDENGKFFNIIININIIIIYIINLCFVKYRYKPKLLI